MNATIKKPSAWIPIVMSLAALTLVLVSVHWFGAVHEADEGTGAHLFQLLIVLQVPIMAYFTIRWLPQAPKPALMVLALQGVAIILAFVPVHLYGL